MLKFTSVEQVNQFYSNWFELTAAQRLRAIRELQKAGFLQAVRVDAPTEVFSCPVNGFPLVRPCSLSQCRYHIETNEETSLAAAELAAENRNCLVLYQSRAKNGRLSAQEVATLLGSTVSEINTVNQVAVTKVQRAIVKEQIEKLHLPKFSYLKGHCVNCEVSIKGELALGALNSSLLIGSDHGWCEPVCRDTKPKWQFLIEKEFGCQFKYAMAAGLSIYSDLEILSTIFEIDQDTIKSLRPELRDVISSF